MNPGLSLRRQFAAGILMLFFVLSSLPSAGQAISGDVVGTVSDAAGAVVQGANVTALNLGTGVAANTISNERGEYRLGNLAVGRYKIAVTSNGMVGELSGLEVTLNHTLTANIILSVAGEQTTVEVVDQSPVLDATSAQVAS